MKRSEIENADFPARGGRVLGADSAGLENWVGRKKVALNLYQDGDFVGAADIIWGAGSLPFVSKEIAFCVKILAKGRAEDAIRVLSEVMERTASSAPQCLDLAQAFYAEGLPLIASRFYGAAMAVSPAYFQNHFEAESLFYDDKRALLDVWEQSGQDGRPATELPMKDFLGKAKTFMDYTQRITEVAPEAIAQAGTKKSNGGPVALHFPNPNH